MVTYTVLSSRHVCSPVTVLTCAPNCLTLVYTSRPVSARDALMALLTGWQSAARAITTDQLGWTDERCTAFVLGSRQVIRGGAVRDEDIVYQRDNTPTAVAEMKPSGTLKGWKENVAAPCAGNALMVAAVSLAFAGPLLEPLGLDGGGIHLRGASSRGKSTIQHVAVSI